MEAVPPGSGPAKGAPIPHAEGAWCGAIAPRESSEVEMGMLEGLMAAGVIRGVPREARLPTGPALRPEKQFVAGTRADVASVPVKIEIRELFPRNHDVFTFRFNLPCARHTEIGKNSLPTCFSTFILQRR